MEKLLKIQYDILSSRKKNFSEEAQLIVTDSIWNLVNMLTLNEQFSAEWNSILTKEELLSIEKNLQDWLFVLNNLDVKETSDFFSWKLNDSTDENIELIKELVKEKLN